MLIMINSGKIHILRSPNRNYLGHQDFPVGIEQVKLTIVSAREEIIPDVLGLKDNRPKLIIRFKEKTNWIKPFICNITNRKLIFQSLQKKNIQILSIDDLNDVILTLVVGKDKGFSNNVELDQSNITKRTKIQEMVDCLRVRDAYIDSISQEDTNKILELITNIQKKDSNFSESVILKLYKIDNISKLAKNMFIQLYDNLNKKNNQLNNIKND